LSIRNKLKYLLVHNANFTNKEADDIILSGKIKVNNIPIFENIIIYPEDTIHCDNTIIKEAIEHEYILFYKPRDIETTHNSKIEYSLANQFPALKHLFFAGRLDKDSEGLLLMTSDGKFANELAHPLNQKEKEYIVVVNKPLTHEFIKQMEDGVTIMGYQTNPCEIKKLSEKTFNIILKEGKNRQIRRMCYKLGYNVVSLKRIRIDQWELNNLKPGEWMSIKKKRAY